MKVPPKRKYEATGIKEKSGTSQYARLYYWLRRRGDR
jgi:hypothetical protein